jgi:sortase A
MKLIISRNSFKRVLVWTQRSLFGGAAVALGYCVFALADAWIFQHEQSQQFEQRFEASRVSSAATPPAVVTAGMIGRIEIPRLDISVIVMEGIAPRTLRRSAGHIPGTALPGRPGNVGISAHRDTFFRPLRNIRRNDIITIRTILGSYRYRVVSTSIVAPQDVAVLNSSVEEVLTLVTCYPFYFVGAAPDRFIVRAERVT